MNLSTIKSPGVYVNEIDAFGNSVAPVPTAIPAFIGYTPQAVYEGKSYSNVPIKVTSFAEFIAIFGYANPPSSTTPIKQYDPQYYLAAQKEGEEDEKNVFIAGQYYALVPDPATIYYMYNSIKLFYQNGGSEAYIVSVGTYGPPSGKPIELGEPIVNANVKLDQLLNGLQILKKEGNPTMYICPEATLLSVAENGTLMQEMLSQCEEMETTISIFDVIGGRNPDPLSWTTAIETFRNHTGTTGLSYGTAYYPFIITTIMEKSDIDYTNMLGGNFKELASLLKRLYSDNENVLALLSQIENPPEDPRSVSEYNALLINVCPTYKAIHTGILKHVNTLPPSGAMAGIMTSVDNGVGVWKAPANISLNSVADITIKISNIDQEDLNMPMNGKAINAIRSFPGMGILIWGARTLDGNSQDWRYISVRRTMIYIEQSCKLAAQSCVFKPNTKNTWEAVKAMISSFLNDIWKQGALQGTKAADAFSVECGLGTTMTSDDIANGMMNITIKVAVTHPAEFIVISFQQKMAES